MNVVYRWEIACNLVTCLSCYSLTDVFIYLVMPAVCWCSRCRRLIFPWPPPLPPAICRPFHWPLIRAQDWQEADLQLPWWGAYQAVLTFTASKKRKVQVLYIGRRLVIHPSGYNSVLNLRTSCLWFLGFNVDLCMIQNCRNWWVTLSLCVKTALNKMLI